MAGLVGATLGLRAPFWVAAVVYFTMLVVTWRITANQTIRDAEAGEGAAMAPTIP